MCATSFFARLNAMKFSIGVNRISQTRDVSQDSPSASAFAWESFVDHVERIETLHGTIMFLSHTVIAHYL
jgi:hypothetical protein